MKHLMSLLVVVVLAMSVGMPATTAHSVTLNWGSVANSTYNVYRNRFGGKTYTRIATKVSQTSYVDHNVVAGNNYYYVVTAVCETCSPQESGYSNRVEVTIP